MENAKFIYRLTFPNGKLYIGQTRNFRRRMREHLNDTERNKENYPLYSAIRKYGWDSVEKIKLLICEENDADYYKKKLIEYYQCSVDKDLGYNIALGGTGKNQEVSISTREKLRKFNLGKKLSEETKLKMSQSRIGYKLSEETRKKISQKRMGMKLSEETRKKISTKLMGHPQLKGNILSPETREKISKANKGKIRTDDMKLKYSKARMGKKRNFIQIVSEDTKIKMSIAHKGKKWNKETRTWTLVNSSNKTKETV